MDKYDKKGAARPLLANISLAIDTRSWGDLIPVVPADKTQMEVISKDEKKSLMRDSISLVWC